MPIDTFMVPAQAQEQQSATLAQEEAYVQAGIDQLEAMANGSHEHLSAREIEDATLTPEQRAAKEALWVLDEVDTFDPRKFDEMNREANAADGYYVREREAVAPVQETQVRTFTPEMAQQSIEQGNHLERAASIARRLRYEREMAAQG